MIHIAIRAWKMRIVSAMMTSDNLAMLREPADLGEAKGMMQERRIEKLLVVDDGGRLTGLLTLKDTEQAVLNPHSARDEMGRLRVAAASTAVCEWNSAGKEILNSTFSIT